MSEIEQRFSDLFLLRAVLSIVVLALVFYHHQQLSPALWLIATVYLASNLVLRVLPVRRFEDPSVGYFLFFIDIAVLTVIYCVSGSGSSWLFLFYLTILMATLGETVPKSIGIGFGISALYIWSIVQSGGHIFEDHAVLLPIPLFLVTAVLCGYLARELRHFRRQVRSLRDVQKTLELKIGQSSEDLAQSEDLRFAAQELAQRFRNLVEDLNAGIWEMEVPTLKITFVSHQMEAILGFPMEKWLQEKDFWIKHVHPEDREHVVERCRKAIAGGSDYSFRYRAVTATSKTIWLQDIVRVVRDARGKVRQLRGVMVDVTDHQQLEEEFRQAQKMEAVGRLAGGVAHDFNNLLTIISGYAQLAQDLLGPDSALRAYMDEILKAGDRAGALVRRLLAFTRRQSMEPQIVDLNTVVKGTDKMVRRLIGEDIEVQTHLSNGLGMIRSDPAQLEQVIVNLAVNARDAMPNGGKLIIETSNIDLDSAYAGNHLSVIPGPYVMLAVTDSGTGMDSNTKAHIFEPFFTTKDKGKGTGLGLATVYGIIKQSGGNVWVYSELGVGTTFKIYLPRVIASAEPSQAVVIPSYQPQGSETVLLLEDEESIRSLVMGILRGRGYTVLEASRPLEAIEICKKFENPIHLLLTDVVMPQMSGREAAEQVVALRPETKVLYMSGYTDQAIAHHGVLNPGVPFLQKPFTPDALAQKVREVLDMVAAGDSQATNAPSPSA
jgi:PAS domain S-box-containing protein